MNTEQRQELDELLQRIDLGQLLQDLTGIDARGNAYPCPDPQHEQSGRTPPVHLGEDRVPVWFCHACNHGGTAVDALMLARGVSVAEAVVELRGGIGPSNPRRRQPEHPARPVSDRAPEPLPPRQQIQAWANAVHDQTSLLDRIREAKGWSPGALAALDVGWDGKRFTIPIHNAEGRLVNLVRYLPGGNPHVLALRGRPRDLFPSPELLRRETVRVTDRVVPLFDQDPIYIVEGEADAITACSHGLLGISVPGAGGWRGNCAPRFAGADVRVLCDHDEPGAKLAQRVATDLAGVARSVRVLRWEELLGHEPAKGFDLSDYVRELAA